jgi:hypothetical protein
VRESACQRGVALHQAATAIQFIIFTVSYRPFMRVASLAADPHTISTYHAAQHKAHVKHQYIR